MDFELYLRWGSQKRIFTVVEVVLLKRGILSANCEKGEKSAKKLAEFIDVIKPCIRAQPNVNRPTFGEVGVK